MILTTDKSLQTDDEGYMVDPLDWDESAAVQLASTEQLTLNEDHWEIIHFMRRYYNEHRVAADARFVIKHMANEMGLGKRAKSRLYQLFPYGYVKQACKIAGMRRPRAWSTG
ncbi:MAG: TusE/DsrC/DsvC family sulfur relay protein [Gammaproteobacteria bacterium]|nr:TusE/DsrC/DsvC family sulfur relay protein [Gammaproteobacteria bacterium]